MRKKKDAEPVMHTGQREMELFRFDVPDTSGDIIPKETAERIVAEFRTIPVTLNYKSDLMLGQCVGLRIDGNKVLATVMLNSEGDAIARSGARLALGGMIGRFASKVLTDLKLTQVALTHNKVGHEFEKSNGGSHE